MLFHSFSSQDERREYGGLSFVELQYCKLKKETKIKKIVSINHIEILKNDSLYILGSDMAAFLSSYSGILDCGIYNNGKTGPIDLFGINYYSPKSEERIIKSLRERDSADDRIFAEWLITADEHNGFYILGI